MQKRVSLLFDSSWVLSRKDDAVLPVKAFAEIIDSIYDVDVLSLSLTECEFVVKDESVSENEISIKISKILSAHFGIDDAKQVVELSIADYVPQKNEAEDNQSTSKTDKSEENSEDELNAVIDKINALVGADDFKRLADECVRVAPGLIKHNTVEAFTHQCYIFAVNEGYGLSTYLELFADLLSRLNLLSFDDNTKVIEDKLPPANANPGAPNPFSSALSHFQRFGSKKGRIVCIDISEWMTKVTDTSFRDFLSSLDDRMGENIVVFRIPFVEKEIINGIKRGIGDVLFVRDVSFVPFDNDELTKCANESLAERGYTMEDDAWEVFQARLNEEKTDGRFYGINTVNKVIMEMIYRKQLDNALHDVDDTVVKKSEILSLASSYKENEKSGLQILDDYIGMETVKERIEEVIAQIEMSMKNKNLGAPCVHMRFVGNPGTGKTTVARVIGKILKEKGVLRNGSFFEYSGRDFCGRYVGETAPKTAAICRDAYGSVLFIDEAYSLYRSDGFSNADYGREAIDTLIAEMENHRSDLVVIMAGYTDEMNDLMRANAGLESRMPYVIEFPNYTREQLYEIFMLMTNKNFSYGDGFEEAVKDYFDSLPDEVVCSKEFSNARFVRNLFERTWGKAVLRSQMNKSDSSTLTKEDFLLASSEKEFKKIMQKQNRTLGFI